MSDVFDKTDHKMLIERGEKGAGLSGFVLYGLRSNLIDQDYIGS